jgi:hypothetical protein
MIIIQRLANYVLKLSGLKVWSTESNLAGLRIGEGREKDL